ncbi:MAG: hypothetical protein H6727_02120 [Myxococcales bacterium]|nr:hypothetical protein [Myxococcales bacterium]
MDVFFATISLVFSLLWVYMDYKAKKSLRDDFPEIGYEEKSKAPEDSWRWRSPEDSLALLVKDEDCKSRLVLPNGDRSSEYVVSLFGYGLFLVMFYLLGLYIYRLTTGTVDSGMAPFAFFLFLLCFLLAWACLQVDARVVEIQLSANVAVFTVNYGIFWQRQTQYHRHPKAKFHGCDQSSVGRTHRINSEYKLIVRNPSAGFLNRKARYLLSCNQTQGSWIMGGLQAWNALELHEG